MGNFLSVKKPSGLEVLLGSDKVLPALTAAATKYMDPKQIGPLFASAAIKEPKILNCTVTSIIDCALFCSRYGLGPGDRGVYLVPFKTTLTTIIDYKGLIQLAFRTGMVEAMNAEVIHENDRYEVAYGTERRLIHTPKIGDRGKPIAAYATCTLTNGATAFRLLDEDEIMRHKPKKVSSDSPWILHPLSMWMKTAVHALAKWIPLTPGMSTFTDAINSAGQQTLLHESPKSRLKQIACETDEDDPGEVPGDVIDVPPEATDEPVSEPPEADADAPPEMTQREKYLAYVEEAGTVEQLDQWLHTAESSDMLPGDLEIVRGAIEKRKEYLSRGERSNG